MELLAFLDKLSPILIVIIPSYFSFKSTQNTKETDKQISLLSDKISAIEKTVSNVESSYVELGGNGAIKVLYEKFLTLEIVEENTDATN